MTAFDSESINYREAVSADEPALWRLLHWASPPAHESDFSVEALRENPEVNRYVANWGTHPGDFGVVAIADDEVCGGAWVRLLGADFAHLPVYVDVDVPELVLAVSPDHQGGGIGTALMERLVSTCADRYSGIVRTVRTTNPAVRLYERLGFETVAELTNRVGTQSVKMVLSFSE